LCMYVGWGVGGGDAWVPTWERYKLPKIQSASLTRNSSRKRQSLKLSVSRETGSRKRQYHDNKLPLMIQSHEKQLLVKDKSHENQLFFKRQSHQNQLNYTASRESLLRPANPMESKLDIFFKCVSSTKGCYLIVTVRVYCSGVK
jgi:hypothetical protein